MKSEPDVYSIDQLKTDKHTWWTGVRNYQARNFMLNDMQPGDEVLFYHSNAEPPGIAGLAVVSQAAQPDVTQFDKKSEYYDEKSKKDNPRWQCVQVEYSEKFKNYITLEELKNDPKLSEMLVIKKGQRLSIQPVSAAHYTYLKKKGGL